jgi:hypothetical protein
MVAGLGLLFLCVLWMSPEARRGNHNERQARLVQLGMTAAQVHHLMGQPQQRQLVRATGDSVYYYPDSPLSSDGVIAITISPVGGVTSTGH